MTLKGMSHLFHSSQSPKTPTSASSSSFPSPYSLSSSIHNPLSHSTTDEIIQNAELIIPKWDINSSSYTTVISLFQHSRKEAKQFLKAVKDLRRAMHFLVSEQSDHSSSDKLALTHTLMQIAMSRLEKELYDILSSKRDQIDPESVSGQSAEGSRNSHYEFDSDSEKNGEEEIVEVEGESGTTVMSNVKAIADCMISCGYGKECVRIYKLQRKSIVDESLYRLGIDKYKTSVIQRMNEETLDGVIKNWVSATKTAVETLFLGEKVLCDYVFTASESVRESCFYSITNEGAINLFRFPEIVTKSKKSKTIVFLLMELHDAISSHWHDIESIFNDRSTSTVKLQAVHSLNKLSHSIHTILSDFESTIQKDSSKTLVVGGGIHPLTRSTMSYLTLLAEHGGALSEVLVNHPTSRSSPLPESQSEIPAITEHLSWIILVLLCKLDSKAEMYKDVSLSYLFLANNLHYIVGNVYTSHLRMYLGDEWVLQHVDKIKLYALNYEKTAWAQVFTSLPDKISVLSSEEVKDCFRRFHVAFEAAYNKHDSWVVPDGKFRDELRSSIAKVFVPVYREFYGMYLETLKEDKSLDVFLRFGPDNMETYLSHLFHKTPALSDSSPPSSPSHGS